MTTGTSTEAQRSTASPSEVAHAAARGAIAAMASGLVLSEMRRRPQE
jgi:hypothetical protein